MAERFLAAYGLGHLLQDERFATNEARVRNAAELDDAVARRDRGAHARRELAHHRGANELTAVAVQTVADIEHGHPHWQARQLMVDVPNGTSAVRMHNVVPRLSGDAGRDSRAGGALGEDNHAVYGDDSGLRCDERERLRATASSEAHGRGTLQPSRRRPAHARGS